jgi:nitrate/nitrite-specific signal transduction histidine kinase
MDDQPSPISPEFPVRLGRQLSLFLAVIVLLMLAAGGVSLYLGTQLYHINREYDQEYAHAQSNDEIYVVLRRVISEIRHIQATGEFEQVAQIRDLRASLTRDIKTFVAFHQQEAHSPDEALEQPLVEKLSRVGADLDGRLDRVAAKFGQQTYLDPVEIQQLRNVVDQGAETAQDLRRFHNMRVLQLSQESQGLIRRNVMLYLAFLVTGGVLVGVASVILHRKIVTPVVRVAGAALGIAEGRTEDRVPVKSRDEIGQLSQAFNVMVGRLQEREGELRAASAGLEKKVHELRSLIQGGVEILRVRDLDAVLRSVVERARDLLGGDAAVVFLEPRTGEEMVVRATSGPPEAFRPMGSTFRVDDTCVAGQGVCLGQCPIMCPEFSRAHLSRPLLRGSDPIGVLCVSNREKRSFGEAEGEILFALALQASLAIENARLYDEVRDYAAKEERRRIARDIHDGVAQSVGLLYLKIQQAQGLISSDRSAQLAETLQEAATISSEAYEEVRQSILGLRTMVSRGLGLIPALTEFLHEFSAQSGIRVDLEMGEGPAIHLPPTSEVQVIRIVQEALTNVRKHAKAGRAWVRLQRQDSLLRVIIEDDGLGWDLNAKRAPDSEHVGLEIMRERAENLRGKLAIETGPGRGTRVTATVPLERTT